MVLAFYYIWFTEGSGRWNVAKDEPLLGRYSSLDRKVILRHCLWAKEYGIDGFIISFWKEDEYGGLSKAKEVAEVFERCGIKYTFYIEDGDPVERIETLLKNFSLKKNLLRVDGKPTFFVYGRISHSMSIEERARLRGISDSVNVFLDGFNGLNGFTSGNMHVYIDLKSDLRKNKERCDYAHAFGGLCALPVSPGFDLRTNPKLYVDRKGGRMYVERWKIAIEAGADIVLLTSFNEWEEGTHVEPSKRYGFKYLKLTKELAKEFKKAKKKRKIDFKAIRLDFEGVCLMEGGKTSVSLLFYDSRKVSKGCKVLIYDSGEEYDPSHVEKLVRYVRRGGKLILAGGPYPMYRTFEGEVHPATSAFGIEIGFGPKIGISDDLKVMGKREYRYFAVGDTRLRTLSNPDFTFYKLLKGKKELGTVVGWKDVGNGKVVFLWKGISEQPYLPRIIREVFDML